MNDEEAEVLKRIDEKIGSLAKEIESFGTMQAQELEELQRRIDARFIRANKKISETASRIAER